MAVQLRADLCATTEQADSVLASRAALPRLDAKELDAARSLARRLARAERIASRTRDRAVAEVGERLASTSGGLAVHPSTIRERAAAVERARAAVAEAEQALADHEADVAAIDSRLVAEAALAAERADQEARHLRAEHQHHTNRALARERMRLGVVVVVALAVAATLVSTGVPWWSAALLPAVVVTWVIKQLRSSHDVTDDDLEGRLEASSLLSQVGANADELFNARRAESELGQQSSLLEARRDRCLEERRVVERAWRELAGDDVDIDQIDDVMRRYDPQHEDARLLAAETVGVRTTDAVVRQFEERWQSFWAGIDRATPQVSEAEAAAERLAEEVARPIVLVGDAVSRADALAEAAPAATIVVLTESVDEPDVAG